MDAPYIFSAIKFFLINTNICNAKQKNALGARHVLED